MQSMQAVGSSAQPRSFCPERVEQRDVARIRKLMALIKAFPEHEATKNVDNGKAGISCSY
jgi:hypothetical protein